MPITVNVVVAADAATTWRRLADVTTWPEWNPACVAAALDPVEQARVGTRMRLQLRHPRGRLFWTTPTITALEPDRHIAFEVRSVGFRAPTGITLTPRDDGTEVVLTSHSRGPLGFTYRLMFPEKAQGLLWSGALTGLARHFAGLGNDGLPHP